MSTSGAGWPSFPTLTADTPWPSTREGGMEESAARQDATSRRQGRRTAGIVTTLTTTLAICGAAIRTGSTLTGTSSQPTNQASRPQSRSQASTTRRWRCTRTRTITASAALGTQKSTARPAPGSHAAPSPLTKSSGTCRTLKLTLEVADDSKWMKTAKRSKFTLLKSSASSSALSPRSLKTRATCSIRSELVTHMSDWDASMAGKSSGVAWRDRIDWA